MQLTRSRARTMAPATVPAAWRSVTIGVALGLVFLLDRGTEATPIQHLYYVPIVLAAIWFGTGGSLLLSSAAVVLYHAANPYLIHAPYKDTDLVQILLFYGIGLGAARVASDRRRLHRLAMTDDLTGLHNLRSFEGHLTRFIASARRENRPLSLLVLDVDRLKSMNDTHGHLAGAEAVRTVGQVLARELPPSACACRYGGDEFVVALPDASAAAASETAQHIRQAVHALAPALAGIRFPGGTLSVSVGVACLDLNGGANASDDTAAGELLFRAADRALYEAKAAGRNRVAGSGVMSAA